MKKRKALKGWAVLVNGVFLREGWGSQNDWIFRTKWIAQEMIDQELRPFDMHEGVEIIPVLITFSKP